MSRKRRRDDMKRLIAAALAASIALAVPAGVASAGDADVERTRSCDGSSDWKLKLSPEDGGLEVEFDVDQNVSGDRWHLKIRHDGELVSQDTRRTRGASGSFEVRIVENDGAGTDAFKGKARNLSTGEVCVGRASIERRTSRRDRAERSLPGPVGGLLYHSR
jgi:hypothetical protein